MKNIPIPFPNPLKNKAKLNNSEPGFSLIATLSVMILLTMICVAMISLSTTTLRSAKLGKNSSNAQSNAKLALEMALAQLQKTTGPDARITAPLSAASGNSSRDGRPLLGVWRGWEGLDRDEDGMPTVPPYDDKEGDYDGSDEDSGRFLAWLVSTPSDAQTPVTEFSNPPSLLSSTNTVKLVDTGTLGDDADDESKVHLEPTELENGSYAWWIGGENQKALIQNEATTPDDDDEWASRMASGGAADSEVFGLSFEEDFDKAQSLKTLDLYDNQSDVSNPSQTYFHDLTNASYGLLTNASNGGWKRDLSLMTENWNDLAETKLDFYTIEPGVTTEASRSSTSNQHPDNALIYPWTLPQSTSGNNWKQVTSNTSWTALQDYCTQYKQIQSSSNGIAQFGTQVMTGGLEVGDGVYRDRERRLPTISRIQWAISLGTEQNGSSYDIFIIAQPILTLWNPTNYSITTENGLTAKASGATFLGAQAELHVGSAAPADILTYNGNQILMKLPAGITLAPGENKIFSPEGTTYTDGRTLTMVEGFTNSTVGVKLSTGERANTVNTTYPTKTATATDNIKLVLKMSGSESILSVVTLYETTSSASYWLDRQSLNINSSANYSIEKLWGEISEDHFDSYTVSECEIATNGPKDIAQTIYGFRVASPAHTDAIVSPIKSRGMAMTRPQIVYCDLGEKSIFENGGALQGEKHPVNFPFDFQIIPTGFVNNNSINFDSENRGYMISGDGTQDGLTRCIMREVPLKPITSLAQLQHFEIRRNNPMPPFSWNLIGNSSAQPLIQSSAVTVDSLTASEKPYCLQFDDSYISNQLLFDDWFVSSIAPETTNWSSSESTSMEDVYRTHLTGETPLPNEAYKPHIQYSEELASETAEELISDDSANSWRTVASEIVVSGMFNLNSTSISAWESQLKKLRNSEVPVFTNGSLELDSPSNTPVSRTTVAGDESNLSGSTTSGVAGSNTFNGYQDLTDDHITAIATAIVEQIQKRGPFLSVSEFINRKLTSDSSEEELALAGTIQSALDTLAESGTQSENPFYEIREKSLEITAADVAGFTLTGSANDLPTGFKFPAAAEGYTLFGIPGWIRQADILRPLAPTISVRDDTFIIRTYGDSKDSKGNILSKAWCEARVQRIADYSDSTDDSTVAPWNASSTNQTFGRKYKVISFRWLNKDEI